MDTTIRVSLVNLLNEFNKLLILTNEDEEEKTIRKNRRVLFVLLEEVVKQEIDANTVPFREAIFALQEAREKVEEAKLDIDKIVDAIKLTVLAAKSVDKIVKIGIDIIA